MIRSLARVLCVAALCGACGESPRPVPPRMDGGPRDAGTRDGSSEPDASMDGGQTVACSTETFELARDPISRPRVVAASARGAGDLVFAWSDNSAFVENVRAADLAMGASDPAASAVNEEQSFPRQLAVSDSLVAWVEENFDEQPVRAMLIETPTVWWDVSAPTGRHASVKVLGDGSGGYWVAWSREAADGTWDIQLRSFDGSTWGTTQTFEVGASQADVTFAVGTDNLYLAWVDAGDVYVQTLDASAIRVGSPELISTESNAEGGIDMVFDDVAGVVVFSTLVGGDYRIHSRLLLLDGTPLRAEQIVSTLPWGGRSPAAIAFGGGFAAAFRGRNVEGAHEVRLGFIHGSDGNVVAEYGFAGSDWDDGPVRVGVTSDGIIGVAWANLSRDGTVTYTAVRAARIECGEAWLRCSRETPPP